MIYVPSYNRKFTCDLFIFIYIIIIDARASMFIILFIKLFFIFHLHHLKLLFTIICIALYVSSICRIYRALSTLHQRSSSRTFHRSLFHLFVKSIARKRGLFSQLFSQEVPEITDLPLCFTVSPAAFGMHSASPRIAARRNSFRPAAIFRFRAAPPRVSLGFTSLAPGRITFHGKSSDKSARGNECAEARSCQ